MTSVLKLNNVGINFGGLKAVDDFNLEIKEGELFGLIGPNGAGKTTVFNMVTGVYSPTEGEILLKGERINGLQPHKLVERVYREPSKTSGSLAICLSLTMFVLPKMMK